MTYVLDCYDDLAGSLTHAWVLLGRGAADRRSPLHTPAVSTIGLDGSPEARTVVLRSALSNEWLLTFHTDVRSEKYRELMRDPRVSLIGYDPASKVQLRCRGDAVCHVGDDQAAAAWARSRPLSRACYRQAEAPGSVINAPHLAASSGGLEEGEVGFENFVQVQITVREIEWLYLAHSGHRRAKFVRTAEGSVSSMWLAP